VAPPHVLLCCLLPALAPIQPGCCAAEELGTARMLAVQHRRRQQQLGRRAVVQEPPAIDSVEPTGRRRLQGERTPSMDGETASGAPEQAGHAECGSSGETLLLLQQQQQQQGVCAAGEGEQVLRAACSSTPTSSDLMPQQQHATGHPGVALHLPGG
jgi:hypothetical protein